MISLTSLALLVSGLGLLLSIGALAVAVHSSVRYRSSSAAKLSARLLAAENFIEQISADFRNLRSAAAMRAHRARKNLEESLPEPAPNGDDTADKTRRELNRKLATGEIKPRGIP